MRRPVLQLSAKQAREFFLKQESYSSIELPRYFKFGELIDGVYDVLRDTSLSDLCHSRARDHEGVNHVVMHNKDGRYAWRPLQLIHPALYVSLVDSITKENYWEEIQNRFENFYSCGKIECLSRPVEALRDEKDKAQQIMQWWECVEQRAIELSLEYQFVVHTDIVDCYSEIYTHSIAWAIHSKKKAKDERDNKNLIGNIIDRHIQDMQNGQTNGIPQGSVLMDFVAEIVLGYADSKLMEHVGRIGICDYRILRYRDDYRIFVNNPQDGDRILKCLTETMIDLGMKLSPHKTGTSSEVIRSSIKDDKLDWMFRKQRDSTLQKHLLIIHDHSIMHPNSGSLLRAMQDFHRHLEKTESDSSPMPLIAVVVDIAWRSPKVYPVSAAVLSRLISRLRFDSERRTVVTKIRDRFARRPNTEHMDTWLQRISFAFDPGMDFRSPLSALILGRDVQLWNSDWISSRNSRAAVDPSQIVDRQALADMPAIVPREEFALFSSMYL